MKKPIKTLLTLALSLCALGALLGAAQGSQTDPLVTLSYLTDVATPKIMQDVDAKLTATEGAYVDKLNAALAQYEKDMDAKLAGVSGSGGGLDPAAVFTVVTVKKDQKLTLAAGGELLLRSGSATCLAASAPGLMDVTDGSTLVNGGTVQPNHLYLSTADDRGILATADVTVMVRGTYGIA